MGALASQRRLQIRERDLQGEVRRRAPPMIAAESDEVVEEGKRGAKIAEGWTAAELIAGRGILGGRHEASHTGSVSGPAVVCCTTAGPLILANQSGVPNSQARTWSVMAFSRASLIRSR